MAEAAREIPDVAGVEVDHLRLALRVDGGDAALALDDVGPFRCVGVPVQLTQAAGDERHQHPGERLRDGKFRDRRLLRPAAIPSLGRNRTKLESERGQFGAGERGRRRPERRLALTEGLRARGSCSDPAGCGGTQHVAT